MEFTNFFKIENFSEAVLGFVQEPTRTAKVIKILKGL